MIGSLDAVVVVDERGRRALEEASFSVLEGEALALVGRNGSGKSTALRVLAGLTTPSSGRVKVFGRDLAGLGYEQTRTMRTRVGLAFETLGLWATRTIGDNIALPARYHRAAVDVDALADELGIAEALHLLPTQANASVKKRALIARALVLSPGLLLCDEPQLGLVRREAKRVAEAIERRRREGMSVVFADHDGELDPYTVTRRVYLEDGRVLDRPSMLPPSLRPPEDEDLLSQSLGVSVRGSVA